MKQFFGKVWTFIVEARMRQARRIIDNGIYW
jgi:hypothetical protein